VSCIASSTRTVGLTLSHFCCTMHKRGHRAASFWLSGSMGGWLFGCHVRRNG